MKVLALFLLTIFLNKGCCEGDAQKKMQKAQLIYTATSRGFFREIIIKNKEVSVQSNRKENIVFCLSGTGYFDLGAYGEK